MFMPGLYVNDVFVWGGWRTMGWWGWGVGRAAFLKVTNVSELEGLCNLNVNILLLGAARAAVC